MNPFLSHVSQLKTFYQGKLSLKGSSSAADPTNYNYHYHQSHKTSEKLTDRELNFRVAMEMTSLEEGTPSEQNTFREEDLLPTKEAKNARKKKLRDTELQRAVEVKQGCDTSKIQID